MNANLQTYNDMLLEYPDTNLVLYAIDIIDHEGDKWLWAYREVGQVIYEANYFPFVDVHFGRVITTGDLAYYRGHDFGEVAEFG